MLVSLRKCAFGAAAAATLAAASGAQAEQHTIMIVDGAYFPATIYAQPGDSLLFTNASSQTHIARGPEGSWTSGPISVEGQFVYNITEDSPLTFTGQGEGDELEIDGAISYDEPPLSN